jgi:hemolysin activation/secretion protein
VRGFTQSYFTGDDAAFLGIDWMFNSPDMFDFSLYDVDFTNVFRPFIFVGYGFGYRYSLLDDEPDATAHIADVGLGLQIAHRSGFSGTLQLAFPVLSELDILTEDPEYDSALLTFNFQYSF